MTSINIAIIDGKGPPQSLIKTLAGAGYICHRARGPLKLREVLALTQSWPILGRGKALLAWRTGTAGTANRFPGVKCWNRLWQKSERISSSRSL